MMQTDRGGAGFLIFIVSCLIALMFLIASLVSVKARDLGQWENSDPYIKGWYKSLMQPDNPTASCCGEADAYYCDDISVRQGKTYCKITDDRPDMPSGRVHRDVGTEFEIPPNKLKWDAGNPTGHAVIFLRVDGMVWCFVQGSGT